MKKNYEMDQEHCPGYRPGFLKGEHISMTLQAPDKHEEQKVRLPL